MAKTRVFFRLVIRHRAINCNGILSDYNVQHLSFIYFIYFYSVLYLIAIKM